MSTKHVVSVAGGMGTRLGRTEPGEPQHIWSLRFTDESSGAQMFEVEFTAEQFALVLGNQYTTGVSLTVGNPVVWGSTHEHKTVVIPLSREDRFNEQVVRENAASYEVDGWKAKDDFRNNHRRTDEGYSITLDRFTRDGEPVILGGQ